jgi:hypothetical protein
VRAFFEKRTPQWAMSVNDDAPVYRALGRG